MPTLQHAPAYAAKAPALLRARGRDLLVVVAVALGCATAMLNVTVATVALVAIKDDPSPALRALAWIGDAYMADLRHAAFQWVKDFSDALPETRP